MSQVTDPKAALNTYLISIGLVVLISTFQTQLAIVEQWRLDWVETLPIVENDFWGWFSSLWPLALILTSAFLLYGLWQNVERQQVYNQVVERDYDKATYKLIPLEEYKKLSAHIPKEVKDAVLARDSMRCKFTNKKLYFEPPSKIKRWIWKMTKDSESILPRMLSMLVDHQLLEFGHIIGRRLRGPNELWNIVPESRSHNRKTNRYLTGKKRRLAFVKLLERGETIHKDCL